MATEYTPNLNHPNPSTKKPSNLTKTFDAGDPVVLTSTVTRFNSATIYAVKGFTGGEPTNNVGNVYIGWSATALPIVLAPGDMVTLKSVDIPGFDLSEIYGKSDNNNDGVYVTYEV